MEAARRTRLPVVHEFRVQLCGSNRGWLGAPRVCFRLVVVRGRAMREGIAGHVCPRMAHRRHRPRRS